MNKNILNKLYIIILLFNCLLYFFALFITDLGTNIKELEFTYILILPCLTIFCISLQENDEQKRKKYIKLYLIAYIFILLGFVFSNNRMTEAISMNITKREYNLIPFKSIYELLSSSLGLKFGLYNIIGNFLMLSPLALLLPLINKKFNKLKNFLLLIVPLIIMVEILQYFSQYGSLDIDDFILNITGAIFFYFIFNRTKIKKLINYIFYKFTIKKNISTIFSFVFLITSLIASTFLLTNIYINHTNKSLSFENMKCLDNKETFIGVYGNYEYYSMCNYGKQKIKIGNTDYTLQEAIETVGLGDELQNNLQIYKKELINNIVVIKENNYKELIYKDQYQENYLYNIKDITFKYKDRNYHLKNAIDEEIINIGNIFSLTEPNEINQEEDYGLLTGKFFNIITCSENYNNTSYSYIIPLDFKNYKSLCQN